MDEHHAVIRDSHPVPDKDVTLYKDPRTISFQRRLREQPIYRQKFLRTIWISWSFVMLGWVEALFGPTFPDLRLIISEPLDKASWLFTATSTGFLVGSVITGFLYDRYNRTAILIAAICGTALSIAAIPWCSYFYLMIAMKFISGVLAAGLDTGGNAEMMNTWGDEAAPYMQWLHFCFSVGGMIAPLVAQPFLADTVQHTLLTLSGADSSNQTTMHTKSIYITTEHPRQYTDVSIINRDVVDKLYTSLDTTTLDINQSLSFEKGVFQSSPETRIHIAYIISSVLLLLTSLPFIVTFCLRNKYETDRQVSSETQSDSTGFDKLPIRLKLLLLGLLSLLMIIYVGTEDTYAGFLMTFTVSHLQWSKTNGSLATSIHWICFGIGRLCAIFYIRAVSITKLLFVFPISLALSFTGLLISTVTSTHVLVWIFIGLTGFSMSVIFPALFTWTNIHVTPVSGKISAMFLTSSSLGIMLFPLIFGYTMEQLSSMWFIYLLLGQSIIWIILFGATLISVACLLNNSQHETSVNIAEKQPLSVELQEIN